ncbi:Thyroid receptor-interacting protein 13 [Termitomyces sp. J132]|nr:Thyroid receptor-interacting protein 13 [Termitomyces sp. J132]
MAASVCELPNSTWEGLWDSLIYADDIKLKLLDYIHATLLLSDANVDFNLVSWNRVVLLHGPPGTGKTSLCRALAQKLSIRLSHRQVVISPCSVMYSHARLLEINSHSLFSKWFSESGKLVQRLFNSITELVDEEDAFLVVLIDEVESLTAARAGAMAGTEPSDGLRVVNALLTQLDKLRHRKNVLIMSTSNLVKAIDSAFVDRADIVQYIDLPSRDAIYEILRTCLCEIVAKGIVASIGSPMLLT